MAVIDADDYLSIAQFYAEAYEGQISLINKSYNALQQLKCLSDVNITLDLLGDFNTAYLLTKNRLEDTTSYEEAVRKIQQHVTRESGQSLPTWIAANVSGGKIPFAWALLSKKVGFDIDSVIDWTTETSSASS